MSFRGSLATMPATDLFDWLGRRAPCGTLALERGTVTRLIDVERGLIRAARSNLALENLGHQLLARGLVEEEELRQALQAHGETRVPLGRVLLLVGAMEPQGLRGVLEEQARESIGEMLAWAEGVFAFTPKPERPAAERDQDLDLDLPLVETVAAAVAQLARRREIRAALPSDELSLWVAEPDRVSRAGQGGPALSAAEWDRLLELVKTGASLDQIAIERGGPRFETLDALAAAMEAGALRLERRSQRRERPDSELDAEALAGAARGRAAGGDREGALALARRAAGAAPDSSELRGLLDELERSTLAELGRELLGVFRVPRLLVGREEVAGLELEEAERSLLRRIDGRWDLMSLIQVIPVSQVEILIACKRLAARGIISL
jgi:hypothetical protein